MTRLETLLAKYAPDLALADLPPGTAENIDHYSRQPSARGRAIQTWLKAVAAAKRHPSGRGIAIHADAPAYVAVCQLGVFSAIVEIDHPPPDLEAHLLRLSGDYCLQTEARAQSSLPSRVAGA